MSVNTVRIDDDPALPRLSPVVYDQTRQYHPFAHPAGDGMWTVQPPGASRPIGHVRMVSDADGQQEFVVSRLSASGRTTAFEGSHPTLFHAVSWLRWRLGVRAD